jgi:AP-3 complex subunit beta
MHACRTCQAIFAQHFLHHFFIYHLYDTEKNKALKLQILVSLADADNIETILRELSAYAKTSDPAFALQVVNSIGRCAKKVTKVQESCLNALMDLLAETEDGKSLYWRFVSLTQS